MTVKINVNDFDHTYFVRLGEQVADDRRKEDYKVSKFEFEEAYKEGSDHQRIEVSRLTLIRMDDGGEIVLTYRVPWRFTRLKAKLRNRLNDQFMTVSNGDELKLNDQKYKVVEVKENGVRIMDSLNREFNITAPKKTGE